MAESLKDFYNLGMKLAPLILTLSLFLPLSAKAALGFHLGSHFGYGRMGSDVSRPTRDMGTFDLQFMPGYRFPLGVMAGMMFDYRMMSQLTDKSEVGNTDYSGRGLLWGLGASFEPGPLKLVFVYDFLARHWYSEPDTTFKGSGFHFLAGYKFMPGFSFEMEYVIANYDTQKVNGVESGLNNDNLHHWNLGFGVSYSY